MGEEVGAKEGLAVEADKVLGVVGEPGKPVGLLLRGDRLLTVGAEWLNGDLRGRGVSGFLLLRRQQVQVALLGPLHLLQALDFRTDLLLGYK